MKKSILSLVLLGTLLSCKKDSDEKACYACIVKTTTSYTNSNEPEMNSTIDIEQCDLSEAEARQFEAAGTSTITSSAGGVNMTVKTQTTCSKK